MSMILTWAMSSAVSRWRRTSPWWNSWVSIRYAPVTILTIRIGMSSAISMAFMFGMRLTVSRMPRAMGRRVLPKTRNAVTWFGHATAICWNVTRTILRWLCGQWVTNAATESTSSIPTIGWKTATPHGLWPTNVLFMIVIRMPSDWCMPVQSTCNALWMKDLTAYADPSLWWNTVTPWATVWAACKIIGMWLKLMSNCKVAASGTGWIRVSSLMKTVI